MSDEKVVNLSDKRPSVFYSVHIEHRWDGTFGLSIDGIGDDPSERSKNSVAFVLLEAIEIIDNSVLATSSSLPRTPTKTMLNAARDWSLKKNGIGIGTDQATGCWQAMYDAAEIERIDRAKGE